MLNVIRDGETYNHKELAAVFGFSSLDAFKIWIKKNDIPYSPINGIWWIAGEDARRSLRMGLLHENKNQSQGESA